MASASLLYMCVVTALGLVTVLATAHLMLALAAAAVRQRQQNELAGESTPQIVVLIPAHDEELVLGATLESLNAQDYPRERLEVVVIADNCTDRTAEIARAAGATVLERANPNERGKGYALDWAMSQLLNRPEPGDVFVIVDADTWVAPDFLCVMARSIKARADARGWCAVQGRYGVLNRSDGWRAALMSAALDLFNHVRPLGYDRLDLPVGLKGNGMAFTRPVLQEARWQGRSITEDIDYGLDLLQHHGLRVCYVPEARVLAQMPITSDQAGSQRERWEFGRYRLLRERSLPLLRAGLARRDYRLCHAALDLMQPPLAEHALLITLLWAAIAAGAATGLLRNGAWWCAGTALVSAGFAAYVVGGMRLAGAPREAFTALLQAPAYALWKLALYAGRVLRTLGKPEGSTDEWVRTARVPAGHLRPAAAETHTRVSEEAQP